MRYAERDEAQRRLFRKKLKRALAKRPVYFLDESGIDHRLRRAFARAPRGTAVYVDVHGSRRGRTSIISASLNGRLVCPFVFDGHCNRGVVDTYLAHVLLPSIPKGSVIVLDNAAFHRSPFTRTLVAAAGCSLMFLPAYSPDLNPIEHIWARLKRLLQGRLQQAQDKVAYIEKICLLLCV